MINKKQNLTEESGDQYIIKQKQGIAKYKDNELVKLITSYIDKNLKDVEIASIVENGDVYTLDLTFVLDKENSQMQYNREYAKSKAYDIKRELEQNLVTELNLPTFSIQGIRVYKNNKGTCCDFSISIIYSNKNKKQIWESKTTLKEDNFTNKKSLITGIQHIHNAADVFLALSKKDKEFLPIVEKLMSLFTEAKKISDKLEKSNLGESLDSLKNSTTILYPKDITNILETDQEIAPLLTFDDKQAIQELCQKMQSEGKIIDEKALYNIIIQYVHTLKAN